MSYPQNFRLLSPWDPPHDPPLCHSCGSGVRSRGGTSPRRCGYDGARSRAGIEHGKIVMDLDFRPSLQHFAIFGLCGDCRRVV